MNLQNSVRIFEYRNQTIEFNIMKHPEMLTIEHEEVKLVIVDGILFIGENDDDSKKDDVSFVFEKGLLNVNGYIITPAMLQVLKMHLNKEL